MLFHRSLNLLQSDSKIHSSLTYLAFPTLVRLAIRGAPSQFQIGLSGFAAHRLTHSMKLERYKIVTIGIILQSLNHNVRSSVLEKTLRSYSPSFTTSARSSSGVYVSFVPKAANSASDEDGEVAECFETSSGSFSTELCLLETCVLMMERVRKREERRVENFEYPYKWCHPKSTSNGNPCLNLRQLTASSDASSGLLVFDEPSDLALTMEADPVSRHHQSAAHSRKTITSEGAKSGSYSRPSQSVADIDHRSHYPIEDRLS